MLIDRNRAMPDCRCIDGSDASLSAAQRQELSSIVPRPQGVEPVHRAAVDARRWLSLRLRRHVRSRPVQVRQRIRHGQGTSPCRNARSKAVLTAVRRLRLGMCKISRFPFQSLSSRVSWSSSSSGLSYPVRNTSPSHERAPKLTSIAALIRCCRRDSSSYKGTIDPAFRGRRGQRLDSWPNMAQIPPTGPAGAMYGPKYSRVPNHVA